LTWPRVEPGAKGELVRTIQYCLRHHGYTLEIDANFGKKTKAAVIAFEKKHGFPPYGVVDDLEWVALLSKLKNGSSGWSVHALQSQLRESGYAVKVDGDFGELTEKAVRSFQRANKLTADGVVNYATWNKLIKRS
jgi:peptidoglycan hydrolase-like protein with peptidoglycan-binding domain